MSSLEVPEEMHSPDPVDVNPFPESDIRHSVWREATAAALVKLHARNAQTLDSQWTTSSEWIQVSVEHAKDVLDIWAERYLTVIFDEPNLPFYEQWLQNYVEVTLRGYATKVTFASSEIRETTLTKLRLGLLGRMEAWRGRAHEKVLTLARTPEPETSSALDDVSLPTRLRCLMQIGHEVAREGSLSQKEITARIGGRMGVSVRDAQAYAALIRPDAQVAVDRRASLRRKPQDSSRL